MKSDRNTTSRKVIRRRKRYKFAVGLNTVAAVLLMMVVVGMVNYLSYRHYWRVDWSESNFYELSQKTEQLLASLTNDVQVIVFFQPHQEVYEDIENLLREYEYASPHVSVTWVDPDRDLAKTEELALKYEVAEANVVVFEANGRSKYVTADDIAEYDYSPMQYGQRPRQLSFKGEQAFSSAIQSITQAGKPTVYFLKGHGEGNLDDYDPRLGFSSIEREIRHDNIDVRTLVLGEQKNVPGDASAVVVLGPDKVISEPEIEILREYLDNNGRLMLLLDAQTRTGLAPLLEDWGVRIRNDLVVDATRTLTGRELFITEYGDHPITRGLHGVTAIFYLPRSVEPISVTGEETDPADKPKVTSLASCSESGWAEMDNQEGLLSFDPLEDIPGPVSVAVAVERGPVPGIDVNIRPTRMVVFGDSDFISNGAMTGGDVDFFLSAMNWLLEREELMAISAKEIKETHLVMSSRQLMALFWIIVTGIPGVVALFGVAVWLRRRG